MVNMISVQSSNLRQVGYDPQAGQLYITFHSGATYVYSGVPQQIFDQLLAAPSKGSFFDQMVKKAGYPYTKV